MKMLLEKTHWQVISIF